jgi:hypothetical protein
VTARLLAGLAIFGLLGALPGCCGKPPPPPPECLSKPHDFRPDATRTQEWSTGNDDFADLPAAMRVNQCGTKFGQAEGIHCGPQINAFCRDACSPEDQDACTSTHRARLMQECREQIFKSFVGALPNCCPLKLEGSMLVAGAATDVCPAP